MFVRRHLTGDDELIVLTHEIGHIFLGHFDKTGFVSDTDVQKEFEATEFSSKLMKYRGVKKRILKSDTVAIFCSVAALVGIIVFLSTSRVSPPPPPDNLIPIESSTPAATPTPEATTEQPAQNPDTPVNADKQVVVTATGKKYHLPDCYYVAGKDKTKTMSIQAAIESGLEPCLICKPDQE